MQIESFANSETEKVYHRRFAKHLPPNIQPKAYRQLHVINAASNLNDLRVPPSNHLEKLIGDRQGQYSIAINNQFRICFCINADVNSVSNVEIVDYHN